MTSVIQRVAALDPTLFRGIETQTADDERRSLLAVQRATAARRESYVYLEIGSHLGGSIQPHLLDPRCTRIFSIDPRPCQQPDDRAEGFIYVYENNSTLRMLDLLRAVDSEQLGKVTCFDADASAVDPGSVQPAADLVFIDGEHTVRAVLSDFRACRRMMATDATVLFHDYGIIAPAVVEICARLDASGASYAPVRLDGSLFALFMDPGLPASDPYLAELQRRHLRVERRKKLASWIRGMTPAPLWPALRVLKRRTGRQAMDAAYTPQFYSANASGARSSAQVIVPIVCELVEPGSVVDVGCGTGEWLSVFAEHGVTDIQGYDGPWVQSSDLVIPQAAFAAVDLVQPLPTRRRYDLAVSLEVAEHLPAASAANLVDGLTQLSDVVLFSAAIPGQGGTGHVNEQWPDYWASHFRDRGYEPVDAIRPHVWSDQRVSWWYAQNTLLFVAARQLQQRPRLLAVSSTPSGPPLRLVHPALYEQTRTAVPPGWSLGSVLRALPGLIARSIRHRLHR